jgi:sirohydrochlorin ferrochelatase
VASPPAASGGFGVLVMAHGGGAEWNQTVLDAVAPLRERHPVEVAFGMADACTIQSAVGALEGQGVRRIGVVRLFVSGESWYERTEQILGLREGAEPTPADGSLPAECAGGHGDHGHHRMALFRIGSAATFALSSEGLMEAPEMGAILADRARGLSRDPGAEDVLVLAHGPGDDAENERWLAHIRERAGELEAVGFHSVRVETLREDWPEKRAGAERRIRASVEASAAEGRPVIVLPFRLSGFGPYAEVLEGHDYRADRQGLLPHPNVTRWIERQGEELRARLADARPVEPAGAAREPTGQ